MSERFSMAGNALGWLTLALGAASFVAMYRALWHDRSQDDPQFARGKEVEARLQQRGVRVALSVHELILCADLVFAEDLTVGFGEVAGLEDVKAGLRDVVTLLNQPRGGGSSASGGSRSRLRAAPKGVLLYGPPGNGKTMLAAALAKEMGSCCFLSVQAASLFQKYMGESEKMAKAVFSLARKLAPCVVFLDEIDLLMQQDGGLNAANNKVLGTLLADWDGLDASGSEAKVVVVATSNNPKNLPASIHRRLPRQYYLGPPDQTQRARILQSILAGEGVDAELVASVAAATGRYCGSDLMELCKAAMSNRLRHGEGAPFEWAHFEAAMQCVRFAGSSAEEQVRSEVREWLHDNTTGDSE